MIRNQTDGYVIHGIYFILLSGHLTNLVADRFHGINIKYGIHILHNNCQTLKPHTGINIFLGKLGITALAVPFKLCKHVVPYFHETVTLTAYFTIRTSASVFFASIIVNFRTRTTWTGTMLPEVVTFSGLRITVKTCDFFSRNTYLFGPDLICFLIFSINGRIKTILLKPKYLCQEFP